MLSMVKLLITGSEGFVGQHFIDKFSSNYSIIGSVYNDKPEVKENVEYVRGDIQDKSFFTEVLGEYLPDVILHLAGIAITWSDNPEEIYRINLFGTLNLYEAVQKLKRDKGYDPKIIYISSSQVYGKTNKPQSIDENCKLNPVNFYANSKLAADRLSFQYSQTEKLKTVILRPFAHIGPGQNKGFFVPDVASQIVEIENGKREDLMVGNLDSIRDYLDVRDVVEVYKFFVDNDFDPGDVFNVCSGIGYKIKDILDILLKLSKTEIKVMEDPSKLRPSDTPIHVGNNSKLTQFTNWQPKYKIEGSLSDTLDYWRTLWKDKTNI